MFFVDHYGTVKYADTTWKIMASGEIALDLHDRTQKQLSALLHAWWLTQKHILECRSVILISSPLQKKTKFQETLKTCYCNTLIQIIPARWWCCQVRPIWKNPIIFLKVFFLRRTYLLTIVVSSYFKKDLQTDWTRTNLSILHCFIHFLLVY